MHATQRRRGVGFLGGFLILIGAAIGAVGAFLWSRAREQFSWDAVDGTICAAAVDFDWEYYRPKIEYTYVYQGRTFRGTRLRSLALSVNWSGPARRAVAKYPVGSTVTLYVNPRYPGESVLERGADPTFIPFILIFSVPFVVAGLRLLLRH
jgi:Protein of unknown function (DUF3592)